MAACQTPPAKPAEPSPQTDSRYEALSEEKKALGKNLAKSEASRNDLEEKLSDVQLRLLEKDSQIKALEEPLRSHQKALDDAFLEVVRSKAELCSLETKAEAASNMAEAEIAVKALKTESGAGDQDSASNSKAIGRMEKGTHVLGYATSAGWIRVGGEDGDKGWVQWSAVGAR